MLENSVWKQYHKDITMREVLSKFYAIDAALLIDDEQALYALLKRKLTKKYPQFPRSQCRRGRSAQRRGGGHRRRPEKRHR